LPKKTLLYDKTGEEHYNLISALHKSVRGSDPQAALYWLARMLISGEDPMYLARRLVRMAIEDIGAADPQALPLAIAARDTYHFLGSPEGDLALAQIAVYLAVAPKSNTLYKALSAAKKAAAQYGALPVPLHIRNAPTQLMKDFGYGKNYKYAFDFDNAYAPQDYLPDRLKELMQKDGSSPAFYTPGEFGFEKDIKKRMAWWEQLRRDIENGSTREDV
jgi:putative ATPase